MNSSENKKKRYKPAERVSLTPAGVELLDKLLSQVYVTLPELKLSKTDLVNWLLKSRSDKLSQKELASIERDHFDPIKALEAAIAEVKKQQGLGEEIDLQALLTMNLAKKRVRPKKPRSAQAKDRNKEMGVNLAQLEETKF